MLTTMSKMLCIGMTLEDVIYRSTVTPAEEIGHPELGSLSEGSEADVAVLRLEHGSFSYTDCGRAKMQGDKKLSCAMTLRAGEVVYDPEGFSMPLWPDAPKAYWEIRQ
jgi:dihydroorotase